MKNRSFFCKCYSRVRAYILPYFYKYNRCGIGVNTSETRQEEIIVSLTSFPARFHDIYICIKSLLNQTMRPDHIILYLGTDADGVKLPDKLLELQKFGLEIVRDVEDIKPHKKYYYAMQSFPNAIVITVDDDCIYDRNLIKDLYHTHINYPNTVVARNVRIIPLKKVAYSKWTYKTDLETRKSFNFLAVGIGGVLYPPHILDDRCFILENIKKICLNADDIWLKYHQLLKNIPVTHSPSIHYMPISLKESVKISLFHKNIGEGLNDKFIKDVGEYYNINIYNYGK